MPTKKARTKPLVVFGNLPSMSRSKVTLATAGALLFSSLAACDPASSGDAEASSAGGKGDEVSDADTSAIVRFEPIDLAFLIPPLGGPGADHISLSTPAGPRDQPLLTPEQLERLAVPGGFDPLQSGSSLQFIEDLYGSMFVTGIRFSASSQDYVHTSDGGFSVSSRSQEADSAELRFVVQPWDDRYEDAALHLVFQIEDDRVPAVLASFAHIKERCEAMLPDGRDTGSTPVGVHPCLRSGDGDFSRFVRHELLAHAHPDRLKGIATMVRNGRFWSWRLFSNEAGQLEAIPLDAFETLTGVPEPAMAVTEFTAGNPQRPESRGFPRFTPEPTSSIATPDGPVETRTMTMIEPVHTDEDRARAATVATLAQNPRRSAIADIGAGEAGIDCASCHIQDDVLTKLGVPDELLAYRSPDPTLNCDRDPAVGIQNGGPNPHPEALVLQVINFGYRANGRAVDDVAINGRTVNEACDAAHFVNSELLPSLELPQAQSCTVTLSIELDRGDGALNLTGNAAVLGDWVPAEGVELTASGTTWSAEVELSPMAPYRFKVARPDGSTWLGGDDVALAFEPSACDQTLSFDLRGRGL